MVYLRTKIVIISYTYKKTALKLVNINKKSVPLPAILAASPPVYVSIAKQVCYPCEKGLLFY